MTTDAATPVYNLIILDESGSMAPIRNITLMGFNEIVQTIQATQREFPAQPQYVSFVTFNGMGIKTLLDRQPAGELQPLTEAVYRPDASTPLLDALGKSLLRLELQLEQERSPTVLVSILTDGEENASREFSYQGVRALIERLKGLGWSFTYMGTDHGVEEVASELSIPHQYRFEKSEGGMQELFARERRSRSSYYEKKRQGLSSQEAEEGYFS